jgi:ABC-type transport system involved in multi-copper enzyme maturation permease subunit
LSVSSVIMITDLTYFMARFLSPFRLTGPIFDKELRVSSRRRRNYVLRFAYVALLTVFLVLVWIEGMGQSGSSLYRISRMAEAGQIIVIYLVWFQFCATQFLAVILLSNSISDEIYHRTLGLLMTTPINSFQIVMGKLLSKLLQLLLLLAISLPLLAIIRVMGGVPWNYVISSLCITLTTVIFVGSLSLFFSIFSRRTYVVIIVSIITLASIFALLPLGLYAVWDIANSAISERSIFTIIFLPNPYCSMFINTIAMVEPRSAAALTFYSWPLNCGIMLAASALLLFVSVIIVRKVALSQATGQLDGSPGKRRSRRAAKGAGANKQAFAGAIRRVVGPPIIWKELRSPIFRRHKILTCILVSIGLILLSGTYYLCVKANVLDDEGTHAAYAVIFMAVGMLFTIVLPATSITSEKESRSWPVLLATPLDDKDILLGKFVGALRRCLPAWLPLFGHIIVFTLIGFIHPFAIVQTGILVTWIVIFLSCSGLYFSSSFKHTTTAVLMNFALVAAIWAILPLLMAIVASINSPYTREARKLVEAYIDTNPYVHMGNIMIAFAGETPVTIDTASGNLVKTGSYYWPGHGTMNAVESTVWMSACMVGYILIGFLFAWRARHRFRRNIF